MNLDIKFVRYLIRLGTKDREFLKEVGAKTFDKMMDGYVGDVSELRTFGVLLALNSELDEDDGDAISDDFLAALAEHPADFGDDDGWNLTVVSAQLIRWLGCAEQVFQIMTGCGDDPATGFKALLKELRKLGIAVPKGKRAWAALKPAPEPELEQPKKGGGKKK